MALGKLKKGSKCVRRKRVRLKSGKTVMRCAKFSVKGGRKAKRKAKRKGTKKRRSTKRKGRCQVVSMGGRRRRVCRDAKGKITSNKPARKTRRRRKRRG